jgi:predicted RNA-binding Zn-ribbon protein involved in translation (DUF1610 family)
MLEWFNNAHTVELVYGGYVNWVEKFYICPECGEPIYWSDWSEKDLEDCICPICEFVEGD